MGRETIHTGQTEPLRHESNGTHFEPQRASVRARGLVITCKSGPHASALRLKIYKVSAIGREPHGEKALSPAVLVSLWFSRGSFYSQFPRPLLHYFSCPGKMPVSELC